MRVVTVLTDFGLRDYYVAAVKGTLLRLIGEPIQIVDVTHEIPPGDIEAAAYILGAAAPSFEAGTVHLAVVDPGVGSERRILAASDGEQMFVAPDNGLLGPLLGGNDEVRAVERADLFLDLTLEEAGDTFHGRDRFAPVAAALVRGEGLDSLGPRIDDWERLPAPLRERSEDVLRGEVVHVDRFGNLVTSIPSHWVGPGPVEGRVGGRPVCRVATHYAELDEEEAAFIAGSRGTLDVSLAGRSLADAWGLERGVRVEIRPASD